MDVCRHNAAHRGGVDGLAMMRTLASPNIVERGATHLEVDSLGAAIATIQVAHPVVMEVVAR